MPMNADSQRGKFETFRCIATPPDRIGSMNTRLLCLRPRARRPTRLSNELEFDYDFNSGQYEHRLLNDTKAGGRFRDTARDGIEGLWVAQCRCERTLKQPAGPTTSSGKADRLSNLMNSVGR